MSDFGSAARFDVNNRSIQVVAARRLSNAASDDDMSPTSLTFEQGRDTSNQSGVDESTPLLHSQAPLSSRVGTVAWSAPELLSKLSYGASVDVYR